jgi:hypothetical protein
MATEEVKEVLIELRDYGRSIALGFRLVDGSTAYARLTHEMAQKVFDDLWKYNFRPTEAP